MAFLLPFHQTKLTPTIVSVASHGVGGGGASMAFEELIQVRRAFVVSVSG